MGLLEQSHVARYLHFCKLVVDTYATTWRYRVPIPTGRRLRAEMLRPFPRGKFVRRAHSHFIIIFLAEPRKSLTRDDLTRETYRNALLRGLITATKDNRCYQSYYRKTVLILGAT